MNYKHIHIGKLIEQKVNESRINMSRICNFLNSNEKEILAMYQSEDIDTHTLLRWSKILEYDFFRLYTQHLILYSPPVKNYSGFDNNVKKTALPVFRKNIYTQ
ncbi:transposase, partial [Chryseobacterium cucumeris]|uniref:transposase n=1 Tax=Chryseobacterium cucumeris TaxID=1813611 RepID=UPI0023F2C4E8